MFLIVGRSCKPAWLCHSCWRSLTAAGRLLYSGGWPSETRRNSSSAPASLSVHVGNSPITFSTGKYGNLADGAVLVESGGTSVMVTAVSKRTASNARSGLPLMVDYRERAAAAGRIPQNFLRRELRPTDNEVLVSRFIDRSIRPLFPPGYTYDTQIICNMLAVDGKHDPEVLSINGAAAALMLSDIPWNGPIGAVRVGLVDDKFCINPSQKELHSSKLDIIVASTKDRILMVEGLAKEVKEEQFCEAVLLGYHEAQPLLATLSELDRHRRNPTRDVPLALLPNEVKELVDSLCREKVDKVLRDHTHMKASRDNALFAVLDGVSEKLSGDHSEVEVEANLLPQAFWDLCRDCLRDNILDHGIRCDGRGVRDLRPIECEVNVFEPLHGSSVFKRGETQVFCTVTFDSPESAAKTDLISKILGAQRLKRFIVHYEFPPFAINETGRFLMPGRREVGHGALTENAILPLLPKEEFPFTIRVNSQVLDSNGSSSMASVCGSSLALFDAGVPMARAAAGVACGLATRTRPNSDEIEKYQILTDIVGIEDACGNMDFKMAGTREGITSLQVDIKGIPGIPYYIFEEAVMQCRDARYQVLDIMDGCQSSPRAELKENGPAYVTIEVPAERRMKLVGTGGHRIRALIAETGAELQTISDDHMSIFAPNKETMDDVMERIETMLKEEPQLETFEVGAVYPVIIKDCRPYGLFVEIEPGIVALVHKSELSHKYLNHPSELGFEIGQKINVKYLGRDPATGRHKVSRKALLSAPLKSPSTSSIAKALEDLDNLTRN